MSQERFKQIHISILDIESWLNGQGTAKPCAQ